MATRTIHPLPKRPVTSFAPPPSNPSPPVHPPSVQSKQAPALAPATQLIPLPTPLSLSSQLLGSCINLSFDYHISCATYTGSTSAIERFRQHIVSLWDGDPDILTSTLVDVQDDRMAVYQYTDVLQPDLDVSAEELTLVSSTTHALTMLHPHTLSDFLRALRTRIIHSLVSHSHSDKSLHALKYSDDSFVLIPVVADNEWAHGWEEGIRRPLMKVSLTLHMQTQTQPPTIHILPSSIGRSTLYPLHTYPNIPLQAAIRLAPYGVPANYMGVYTPDPDTSPEMTKALMEEYALALKGHGHLPPSSSKDQSFVRVWIPIRSAAEAASASNSTDAIRPLKNGVECVYPRSLVFIDAEREPSLSRTLILQSGFNPVVKRHLERYSQANAVSVGVRAREIGKFVEAVWREREGARGRMNLAHAHARKEGSGKMKVETDKDEDVANSTPKDAVAPVKKEPHDTPAAPEPGVQTMPMERSSSTSSSNSSNEPLQLSSQHQKAQSHPPISLTAPQPSSPPHQSPKTDVKVPPTPEVRASDLAGRSHSTSNAWLDFAMIDMQLNPTRSSSHQNSSDNDNSMGMDFERGVKNNGGPMDAFDFTDDDFNFFENPSPLPAPSHRRTQSKDGWMPKTEPPSDDAFGLALTDVGMNHLHDADALSLALDGRMAASSTSGVPDLLPAVMGSPQSSEQDAEILTPEPNMVSLPVNGKTSGGGMFDPIIFDSWEVGDKYGDVGGKFPLSSPRLGYASGVSSLDWKREIDEEEGWKKRYEEQTDPRIGVVRMLKKGRKRVRISESLDLGSSEDVRRRGSLRRGWSWCAGWDGWESTSPAMSSGTTSNIGSPESGLDNVSVVPLEDEDEDSDEDCHEKSLDVDMYDQPLDDEDIQMKDSADSPIVTSAVKSNIPSFLLLGPSLLYTRFAYSSLHPHSTALLQSSSQPTSPVSISPQPISAPTPVSPGANSIGRQKKLEDVVNILAREFTENIAFFEGICTAGDGDGDILKEDVSLNDIWKLQSLFDASGLRKPLILDSMHPPPATNSSQSRLTSELLRFLRPPHLSLSQAKAEQVVHVLPTALRFWDKLGLAPRSGQKNILLYVVYEDGIAGHSGTSPADNAKKWWKRFEQTYQGRSFGQIKMGRGPGCIDGCVPVEWDSCGKSISIIMADLPPEVNHIVIMIVVPLRVASLVSPMFRQLLLHFRRLQSHNPRVLFHFIPEYLVYPSRLYPISRHDGIDNLACSVYDRLLNASERLMSRQFFLRNPETIGYFQVPAFTLARKPPSFRFTAGGPGPSLDIAERHMIMHVGYEISQCGRWLIAACVDQLGEAHDFRVWTLTSENDDNDLPTTIASDVWRFAMEFARKADVEWRVVISKVGVVGDSELNAWSAQVEPASIEKGQRQMHVSILSIRTGIPWSFIPPKEVSSPPQKEQNTLGKHLVYTDITSSTFSLHLIPGLHSSPPSSTALDVCISELAGLTLGEEITTQPTPILSRALIRVPLTFSSIPSQTCTTHIHFMKAFSTLGSSMTKELPEHMDDIITNFHQLSILTHARWGGVGARIGLPFHLAALNIILRGLDISGAMIDI